MWPEILKQLRNGLVFNPLTELQKRATQFGEGVGEDLAAKRAQAAYAAAHPESQRAQIQRITNAATLALQTWKPIEGVDAAHLAAIDKSLPEKVVAPAMANKKTGLFNTGLMHFEAVPGLIRALVQSGKSGDADVHGWLTSHGRIVSGEKAAKIKKGELSSEVKAQMATRAQQSGKAEKLTSEDFRGKLTANRGTKADPPMTLADMDRIVAQKNLPKNMLAELHANKGFTFNPLTGEKITAGFAVGGGNKNGILLKKPLKDLTRADLYQFIEEHGGNLPKGTKWGGWVDEAGDAYIEPADIHATERAAAAAGLKRGEKSLYDLSTGKEIELRYPPFADSVLSKLPAVLQGKSFKNDVDKRLRGALWETSLHNEKAARDAERAAAQAANARDYPLDKDSRAALKRGDKQRRTGVAQDSLSTLSNLFSKMGRKPLTPERIREFNKNLGNPDFVNAPYHMRFPGDGPGVVDRIGPKGIWSKWLPSEKEGVESSPLSGKLYSPGKTAGYIIPEDPDVANSLSIRNQLAPDIEKELPSKPGLTLLDSLANMRGTVRPPSPSEKHLAEFRAIDSAWNVSHAAWKAAKSQLEAHPEKHRQSLMDALRGGPLPPKGDPSLMGQYDDPEYIPTVEAVKYAKQLSHQFQHALKEAQKYGNAFYGTKNLMQRETRSRAVDIEMAARHVIKQAHAGVFVPPHATAAEAAAIIGHGNKVVEGLHHWNPDILKALKAAMDAARFLNLKD